MTPPELAADRVIAGRWRLLAEAPGDRHVARWRASDVSTGEPVEILACRPGGADRIAAFVELHRGLLAARAPALAAVRELVDDGGGLLVVRDPLDDATLADLRLPLDPATAAWIAARIGPAVLAAGSATGGALDPRDVGLDAAGAPVLAPVGRVITRVDLGMGRNVAPETFAGRPPDGRAGLYGLGAWLYRAITGIEPLNPGPSGVLRPPGALRSGVPPALDRAILLLLDADPARRPGALPLLDEVAGPPVDLRAQRVPPAQEARPTAAIAPAPEGAHHVWIAPDALRGLTPDQRSRAAGLAGVPTELLDRLAGAGLPLVVGSWREERAAARAAKDAADAGLPVAQVGPAPWWPWLLTVGGWAVAAVILALAALLYVVGLTTVAAVAGMAGVAAGATAVAGTLMARGTSSRTRLVTAARQQIAADHGSRPSDGPLARVWERLGRARRALREDTLPEAAAVDLRSALKEVERRLEGLAEIVATADAALRDVDLPRLRTRAATAPDPAERAALARTLADVDAISAGRRDALHEAEALEDALDGVLASVGRVGVADATGGPEELQRTTDLVRRTSEALRRTVAEKQSQ